MQFLFTTLLLLSRAHQSQQIYNSYFFYIIIKIYKRAGMDQQIEEFLRKQQMQGQKVSLGSLRHRPKANQNQIDQQTLTRLQKLKKYSLHDPSILTQKLNNYYCSLCGCINLVSNVLLQTLPKRKTDKAYSINLRTNFIKLNLQRQKIKHIKRQNGIQVQYRWKCQCGMPIGYTGLHYDEFEQARKDQNFQGSNKPYFYVYQDSLVQSMKESKLISELITYKQTILLHLKRKTKK